MDRTELLLALLFLVAAALYSSVGHAGASGYLAAMGLMGTAPEVMRPTALTLNILVASIGTVRYLRAGQFAWQAFWPFAATSIPFAFLAGTVHLPADYYRPLVGLVLLASSVELFRTARRAASESADDIRVRPLPALGLGALLGTLAGLTGTGGGIFLSPLLLFLRWCPTRKVSGVAAAFILLNSMSGLAGAHVALGALPSALPLWIAAVAIGGLIGTQLGTQILPVPGLRRMLAAVLVVAGLKLILD